MNEHSRLWKVLAATCWSVLRDPPVPRARDLSLRAPNAVRSQDDDGDHLFGKADIETGRQVWQTTGGQQLGSIWGHGGYVAPDWSADWLHREATGMLELWATRDSGKSYAALDLPQQAAPRPGCGRNPHEHLRSSTGVVTVSADRAAVIAHVARHYQGLFGSDLALTPCARSTR